MVSQVISMKWQMQTEIGMKLEFSAGILKEEAITLHLSITKSKITRICNVVQDVHLWRT
jgi:hypothetical protein